MKFTVEHEGAAGIVARLSLELQTTPAQAADVENTDKARDRIVFVLNRECERVAQIANVAVKDAAERRANPPREPTGAPQILSAGTKSADGRVVLEKEWAETLKARAARKG